MNQLDWINVNQRQIEKVKEQDSYPHVMKWSTITWSDRKEAKHNRNFQNQDKT